MLIRFLMLIVAPPLDRAAHHSEKGWASSRSLFSWLGESELVSHASKPTILKTVRKRGDRLVRKLARPLGVGIQERKLDSLSE
jgi:hypothetical protein